MKSYSIPRRTFLKTSAAAVVPYFFTNAANAADADKIRVASIGVGGRGTHIGKQAASLEHVVACVDVHDRNANRFAEQVTKQHGVNAKSTMTIEEFSTEKISMRLHVVRRTIGMFELQSTRWSLVKTFIARSR
jgi:D-arabinose 1-dehydrogenase-like Zn-dependent alcohol dehydrogenase